MLRDQRPKADVGRRRAFGVLNSVIFRPTQRQRSGKLNDSTWELGYAADASNLAEVMAVKVSYFIGVPNVGDRINPHVVEAVSGQVAVWTGRVDQPHVLAIGSMLSTATGASSVWGTGLMHPQYGVGGARAENIHAVRGPLTWRALRENGHRLHDMPLGDPGYLAPALLGIERKPKRDVVGVVAHYADRERPQIQRLLASDGALDLNVHADPVEFLQAMATCEAVISSSLHGLVFAEALGIPNLWITAGHHVGGDGFKFRDWFGTVRKPQSSPQEAGDGETLRLLASLASLHDTEIDSAALAAAFPANHKTDVQDASHLIQ